jgi:hypothetical protein
MIATLLPTSIPTDAPNFRSLTNDAIDVLGDARLVLCGWFDGANLRHSIAITG